MLNGGIGTQSAQKPMSVDNEQCIPVCVKFVEAQSATIRKNKKIIKPSVPKANGSKEQQDERHELVSSPTRNSLDETPTHTVKSPDITLNSPTVSPTDEVPAHAALVLPNRFQFDPNLSYAEKVAHEIIITEKIYLDNLKQIIDGFLLPVSSHSDLDVSQEDIDDLFINVEEIYNFNWVLLRDMEECNYDPVKLAECFVVKQSGFDVYTKYCTHYPRSMEVLLEWNQREDTANFIKNQQETLGHTLPLCSFLLKPVQRILKYHLLLGSIAKHYKQSEDEEGFEIIQKALSAMTNVAKHINDMKRKHEDAVRLQEIRSVLVDYQGPNLTSFGSLVLENTFRLHGTKTGRHLFLFEKALLITKRRADGTFTWKATVMYSNMMLADSIFREPLTFQVIPFDDRKICYTFVARDLDTKHVWLLELKRRLLDSYTALVPMKAKQIILGNGGEECEKENAEPECDQKSANNVRKGSNQQRTSSSKDYPGQSNKVNKSVENERRKSRESEEILDDKSFRSNDSVKSPLRRKLRVFKKRKFSNKESPKVAKRVSWSSDDNPDYVVLDSETTSPVEDDRNQNVKTTDDQEFEPTEAKQDESKHQENYSETSTDVNDNVVSIDSLLRDGATLVSVQGEARHSPGQAHHREGPGEDLPVKKRRLAREHREKCKSMPGGEFPVDGEEGLAGKRASSVSRLYEKFTADELLSSPASVKQLQSKYGLVNVRENAASLRTRRLGSYDEQLADGEGNLYSHPAVGNLTDDALSKMAGDTSVKQTMKCVSAAFSDVSPCFTPEKTPASSSDDLTEDFTCPDEESDELEVFEEQEGAHWDNHNDPPLEEDMRTTVESEVKYNGLRAGEDEGKVWGDIRRRVRGDTSWPSVSNEDEDLSNNDLQSNDDRNSTLLGERSSCVDPFSDSYDDQDDDSNSSVNYSGGAYQRVFTLKRAYSEENLVSKCAFNGEMTSGDSSLKSPITSRSCGHFGQKSPVVRSKSAESSSPHRWTYAHPFTFSVTPKKKIVIKDSLWETIKEDPEFYHHERSLLGIEGRSGRRKKKRRSPQKGRDRETTSTEEQKKGIPERSVLRSCATLEMGDYRKMKYTKESEGRDDNMESASEQRLDHTEWDGVRLQSNDACDTQRESSQESSFRPVTKVEVALKKKKSTKRERVSVRRVDDKGSQIPRSINYVCIEAVPSDESETTNELTVKEAKDCGKADGASKVERLSHYFNSRKADDTRSSSRSVEPLRNSSTIKKRVEELKRREVHSHSTASEEKTVVKEELNFLQNIRDRIDELQRSTSDERKANSKMRTEVKDPRLQETQKVRRLTHFIEENTSSESSSVESGDQMNGEELGSQLQTRLRIRERIGELHCPSPHDHTPGNSNRKKLGKNPEEESCASRRIKDRIEKLQKGNRRDLNSGRDITICDDSDTTAAVTSPRQNEELRTVVIKRGWVQQFIQRIETGS